MQIEIKPLLEGEKVTDTYIAELLNTLVVLFDLFIAQEEEKRAKLQLELDTLKNSLDGYVRPDYGMLPVPPIIHERVIELARARGVAPGVLMTKESVRNHLLEMLNRELL